MSLSGLSIRKSIALIQNHDKAIARWISHIISPHIVGVVLTSVIAWQYSDNPASILMWLAGLLPLLVIPPLVYLMWLVHKGKLADIYMPDRENRLIPLVVLMLWLLLCMGVMYYLQAPMVVIALVFAAAVLIGALGLVTIFWKISFHGAAISAAATTTVMMAGSSAWPVMLLVPLVGWARVRLKRHTLWQVVYGSLVGALLALFFVQKLLIY